MRKAIGFIKRMFLTQYRLTTIDRGKAVSRYCYGRKRMRKMLNANQDAEYWTVYKRGPFGLTERAVDWK